MVLLGPSRFLGELFGKVSNTAKSNYEKVYEESRANPYAKKLLKTVTMNFDVDVIGYFKSERARTDVPYQTLINLYLAQCAEEGSV